MESKFEQTPSTEEQLSALSKQEVLKMAAEYKIKEDATSKAIFEQLIDNLAKKLTPEEMKELHKYFIDKYEDEHVNNLAHKYEMPDDYYTDDEVKRKTLAKILIENTASLN